MIADYFILRKCELDVDALYRSDGKYAGVNWNAIIALALGIAVGRLGCFFAGLPDYTYGTPTELAWGVDFGDGIARHPVQLYESAAMLLFLALYLRGLAVDSQLVRRQGFYLFVGWYAVQRFAWEFLKPYPPLVGPFNVFHLICIVLIGYSVLMMRQSDELRATD